MDYRSADSITSWFVRSRKPLPDQEEGREQKDQQGGSKQHNGAAAEKKANPVVAAAKAVANAAAEKKAAGVAAAAEKKAGAAAAAADKQAATALAAAEDKKAGAAAAAEAKKVTGAAAAAADKKAAGAAAAAAAAIKKAAGSGGTGDKKPAAAAEKKAAAAAAADTAKGRRAGPGSSSSSETDSDDERERQHAERQRAAEQLKAQKKKAAEERQARDEEAEYRPRIMAYSDSDSDVESHFTRVKTHLLPPSEEKTAERAAAAEAAAAAAAAAAQQAAAIEAALAQRTASRRLSTALAAAGRAAAPHMTAGLAGRATGLLVLGRIYPRATHVAGLVSMAVPLASTAALRAGLDLSASLPAPLLQAATEMGQLGKAAAAVAASRILLAGLRQRQRRRLERQQRRSQQQPPAEKSGQTEDAATGTAEVEGEVQEAAVASGRLLRRKSSVNLAALGLCADLGAAIERRQPESAADWAAVYAAEMREMRRMLQENEVELPPNRFDASNAELMRYARACGLISAKTPEQRAAALEAGVSRVVHTSEWVARQRWMSDRELRRWERLVAWKAHDSSGRPILLARLGRAQQLVKPERCEDMATALLTLVHRGLSTQLSNTAGPAEQMVVVLDCRGGSSMGLGRHMGLLKKLAVTLNQHYPDRLYRLHLLELPLLLRWVMHGITPLLHPNTRSKVVFSSMTDPGLPVTVAHLSKTRSALKPFSLKRSLSNCSFPSSGDATPALRSPQHTPALGSLGPAVSAAAIQLGSLEAACSGGGAAGGGCSVASTPRQQQQQQPEEQPLGEEDMPTTPPPTLKVPQSPREGCKPRGQAQARSLARQLSMSDEQQQEQQQLLGLVPPSPFGSSLGLDLQQRPQLQLQAAAQQQQQQQPLPVPLSGSQAGAALNPAAAPGSTAESASAGVVSHAVPWSPGAQSPASSLSRVSSYHSDGIGGEEPVAAAPAKAAADAAKELEEWRLRRQAAATAELRASLELGSSGSQAGGSQRMLRVESADSLRSLAVLPAPPAVAAPAPASAPAPPPAAGSTGSGGKLAGWLGALLPAGAPQGDPSQQQLPPRGRRPSVGRLALGGVLGGSFASSAPSTALGGRLRKGGLVELPDRQLRLLSNPGRGPAPRKSSLRRSESADPLPASRRQLGSHPLRRQSSVSWAEELESVKEIMPRQLSPRQVARARMTAAVVAAAAQPQLVLVACMSLLVLVALLQRALLSLVLAA